MLLLNDSLKFTSSDMQICWNFLLKNVSSFCSAKATHIFPAKNIIILCIESAKTVNEMTLNELIKLTTLWTTGPWTSNSVDSDVTTHYSLIWIYAVCKGLLLSPMAVKELNPLNQFSKHFCLKAAIIALGRVSEVKSSHPTACQLWSCCLYVL